MELLPPERDDLREEKMKQSVMAMEEDWPEGNLMWTYTPYFALLLQLLQT